MSNKIEQFNKFLEDNDCKESYYYHMGDFKLEEDYSRYWISSAFTWDETPEEWEYWADLNDVWELCLDGTSEE